MSPPGVVEDCSIDGFFCLDGELTCGQGRAAIQNRLGDLAVRFFIANSLLVAIFATYALLLVQNGRHIILANRYSRPAIQRFDCLSPTSRLTLVVVMIGMGCEHGFVRQVSNGPRPTLRLEVMLVGPLVDEMFSKAGGIGCPVRNNA